MMIHCELENISAIEAEPFIQRIKISIFKNISEYILELEEEIGSISEKKYIRMYKRVLYGLA